MAKVCLCLTGRTILKDLELVDRYRSYIDVAELRVDFLDPDERFYIRRFPALAGIPTILTVRRKIDGGNFVEGEGARIVLLAAGLAFADTDRRRNFAYVDLEDDLDVPSLEEAARTFGTKIIRSYHNFNGVDADLEQKLRSLRRTGDEIAKAAVMPQSYEDVAKLYQVAEQTRDIDKILIAMGPHGVSTRILAEKLGSHLSFTSPLVEVASDADIQVAGPGQLDPKTLVDTYRFRSLTKDTKVYGIIGYPLTATSSPQIHNRGYDEKKIDAVYIPFPVQDLPSFFSLADTLDIQGLSVTVPHKETVLSYCSQRSSEVERIGSCNTLVKTSQGWAGYNTDAKGFSDSLLHFIGKQSLWNKRVTIIGAGGVAKAVAAEVYRLKGRALILNRTQYKAKEVAEPLNFAWAGLDNRGIELMDRYRDIIIQTTSVGMEPNIDEDPIELYKFRGKEVVMDLIYKPEETKMLKRAAKAGCKTLNGYDMLLRQAKLQFLLFTGQEYPD
ncbi:shikimate dehydrogenase [Gracilinema caldarium]|uniref:shikimate dehydrogenase n=1 Tax=Gracilinema caldarium TaxID=215591 RepID=UPI0026EDD21C|nr:shikimate dehydrogenase [Gracilinema caldarium]